MSSVDSLNNRLDTARQQLIVLERRLRRSARLTAIVGFIILVLIAGYFYFGYTQIKDLLKPDHLVALAGDTLDQKLPEARQALQDEIIRAAPGWAEQLSQQLIQAAPRMREKLEDYALSQTKETVDQLTMLSENEFRRVLDEHRDAVQKAIEELAQNENVSDDVLLQLEKALEAEMKSSIQDQAQELLHTLFAMRDRLEKLEFGQDLNSEEHTERRILMIVRRLQMDQLPVERLGGALSTVAEQASGTPGNPSLLRDEPSSDKREGDP